VQIAAAATTLSGEASALLAVATVLAGTVHICVCCCSHLHAALAVKMQPAIKTLANTIGTVATFLRLLLL